MGQLPSTADQSQRQGAKASSFFPRQKRIWMHPETQHVDRRGCGLTKLLTSLLEHAQPSAVLDKS